MLKKIIKIYFSFLLEIKFFFINLFSKKCLKVDEHSKLNVSLTTYNKRLNKVYLTIETLFCQTIMPSSITLWLSKEDIKQGLPKSIKRLQNRGLMVNLLEENIYSYKKIYYSYILNFKDNSVKIVTVDDDVFYPDFMLSELNKKHSQTGGVVCFRGHYISFDNELKILPYKSWLANLNKRTKEKYLLPTGVGGVLYPIQSLKGLEFQKNDFMNIAPTADDVWLKFLTLHNNFKSYRVLNLNFHPLPILSFNMKGLEINNVYGGNNDKQILKVVSYFNFKY